MFDVLSIGKIILQLPSFSNVKSDLIPLAFIALLFDSVIIAVWYMAATLLQNPGARESAKNEFYQFVGTIVLISIIIFVITTISVKDDGEFTRLHSPGKDADEELLWTNSDAE